MHPDHRAAGFLTVDAVVAARDPHYLRRARHPPPPALRICCSSRASEPNLVESLSTGHVEAKVAALLAHESQFESTMHITDGADAEAEQEAFRERVRHRLSEFGALAGVEQGEAFKRMNRL